MKRNIVLIGFMGVGKGRTARELAAQTGRYAVDCDDLIESFAKMKIRNIFRLHGEEYFRTLEMKTALWLEKNVQRTIISTGGGFVNVPNLSDIGTVVYLKNDFDSILKSILEHPNSEKKIKKRPLLQDEKKARRLFEMRLPLYHGACHLEIDVGKLSAAQAAAKIIKKLGLKVRKI